MKVGSQKCFRVAQVCWNASRIRGRRKKKNKKRKGGRLVGKWMFAHPHTDLQAQRCHLQYHTCIWKHFQCDLQSMDPISGLYFFLFLWVFVSLLSALFHRTSHTQTHTRSISLRWSTSWYLMCHASLASGSWITTRAGEFFFPHAASWLWTAGLDPRLVIGWPQSTLMTFSLYDALSRMTFEIIIFIQLL